VGSITALGIKTWMGKTQMQFHAETRGKLAFCVDFGFLVRRPSVCSYMKVCKLRVLQKLFDVTLYLDYDWLKGRRRLGVSLSMRDREQLQTDDDDEDDEDDKEDVTMPET
jgi:hypothetical protein